MTSATEVAFYYPSVHPPLPWIKRTLLYWDGIASLVHADFWSDPNPELAWLAEQGLYEAIHMDHVGDPNIESAIVSDFIEYLASVERSTLHWSPNEDMSQSLRYGKLPLRVQQELIELGVTAPGDTSSLLLRKDLLDPLICICAKYACTQSSRSARVYGLHTFSSTAERIALEPLGPSFTEALRLTVEGLLPVPNEHVPLADILAFKGEHSAELTALRSALSSEVGDALARGEPLESLRRRLRDEVEASAKSVRKEMINRRWKLSTVSVAMTLAGTVPLGIGPGELKWIMDGIGTAIIGWGVTAVRGRAMPPYAYLYRSKTLME